MITIPDIKAEGKVGIPTEVEFKGYAEQACLIKVQPSCGCTKGRADYEVEGNFTFKVTLDSRKYPQKVDKTVHVYVSQDSIPKLKLSPKFTVNII